MTDLSQMSDAELLALYKGASAPTADFTSFARQEAERIGLDPDLVTRVMQRESAGDQAAVSPKGARGLMQLMPGTAAELGVNPDDPYDNIRGGVRYLKQQMDAFGDERLALAAYNAGPGAVRKYGGVPPYAETQAYVEAISGPDLSSLSDDELLAMYGQGGGSEWQEVARGDRGISIEVERPRSAPRAVSQLPQRAELRPDDALGFQKGVVKPLDNAAGGLEWLAGTVGLDKPINALGELLGLPSTGEVAQDRQAALDRAAAEGRRPGGIGEFVGNVVGTLPLGALRGGAIVQGAASGAALTDAKDAQGVIRDAAIGGAAGKVADEALKLVGKGAQAVLGKAPKVPGLEQLRTAKRDAYNKVAQLGGVYTGKAKNDLLANLDNALLGDGLDQGANPGAWAAYQRARTVLSGKKPITLTDLDNLRQTAYRQAAGLKGPDKEAERYFGQKIIDMIDDFVDTATPAKVLKGNADELATAIREARSANQRFRKYETITNRIDSADLRAASAYTGANTDNTIRQQIRPLIDKTSGQRMRGLTADEAKAARRVVTGTPTQNAMRTVGALVDPRKILGMGLQGAGGLATGGMSLLSAPAGMLNTALANRASQKNVQELLRLIAAGGSREALKKQATPASRGAAQAVAQARRAAGLTGAAAASRAQAGFAATREKRPTRSK